MAPKKALEPVTIDKEKLTAVLEQLASDDKAQMLEGLQTLLRGTEDSAELKYEMAEKNVVGLILTVADTEDQELQLVAMRILARYATYQGKLRKAAGGSRGVTRLWRVLQQFQKETEAKAAHERKEAEAAGGDVGRADMATPPKDAKKGGKDKKGGKGKAAAPAADSGPQFLIPSAELLEAALRALITMALMDTKVIARILSIGDMGALVYIMKHPHPLIKERTWKLIATLSRSSHASVAMYDAGVIDMLLPELEVLDVQARLRAVEMLIKLADVPDSRLERLSEAGVPQLLYRYMCGLDPLNAPLPEEVKETKGGKGGKGKGVVEEERPEQSPEMHALQAACARLLTTLGQSIPTVAEYVASYNGLDVLQGLLPVPVPKQLEKYGLPALPVAAPEPSQEEGEEEQEGDEEEEEEEEEAENGAADGRAETPPEEVLKSMMMSKAEREAMERAKAEEAARLKAEAEAAAAAEAARKADWEANVKEMPKMRPGSSAVQGAVLQLLRTALASPELRARMQEAPWPQMILHVLHATDPAAAPPPDVVAEPKTPRKAPAKGGKDAKGSKTPAKGGKTAKAPDPVHAEPSEEMEQEWEDPTGPLYPPFEVSVRAGALEVCGELLQDWQAAGAAAQHFTAGPEMTWLSWAVDHLRSKTELLDPLDMTLATRLALALGDVGLAAPEDELLKSGYIALVKNFAVLAQQSKSRHLSEAVGRASLALPSDKHFTAIAEPPPPSPVPTPLPDPLITSKYMWDAYGKPVNVDGFVLAPSVPVAAE